MGGKDEFKLFIRNLPKELNQNGIEEMFKPYGEITGFLYRYNWAFITYKTYHEAEFAIRDLNGKPPLYLTVEFAKQQTHNIKESQKEQFLEKSQESLKENISDTIHGKNAYMRPLGRGKPMSSLYKLKDASTHMHTINDDLNSGLINNRSNSHENKELYTSADTLWTRGHMTITKDGKRHVSSGRGYTFYEIPDPHPKVDMHITKVYEKRTASLYEYGDDVLQCGVGKCSYCSKMSKSKCGRCNIFYCNKNCQIADWPRHKIECSSMPNLIKPMNATLSRSNSEECVTISSLPDTSIKLSHKLKDNKNENKKEKNVGRTLLNLKDHKMNNKNKQSMKNCREESVYKNNHKLNQSSDQQNVSSEKKLSKQNTSKKNSFTKKEKNNALDISKNEEGLEFQKNKFLSPTEFTTVFVSVLSEKDKYWIQKVEDKKSLEVMMVNLQHIAKKAQKIKPMIGKCYAVYFEEMWQRVVLISLNPTKVHFIDFGNEEIITNDDFREIDHLEYVQPFAQKIHLTPNDIKRHGTLKVDQVLYVKPIKYIDRNNILVVLQEKEEIKKNDSPNSEDSIFNTHANLEHFISKNSQNLSTVIDSLLTGEDGNVEVNNILRNNVYNITIVPNRVKYQYDKVLHDLSAQCENLKEQSKFVPSIGDLICGQIKNNGWLRGYVSCVEPVIQIATVDKAKLSEVQNVVPYPKHLLNVCTFGAVCEIDESKCELQVNNSYKFEVIKSRENLNTQSTAEIRIFVDDQTLKSIITPWNSIFKQKALQYATLKNECEVCIAAYYNQSRLYVRSLDIQEIEYYHRIMQNVAKCAVTAPYLKNLPVIGQMVIAKYIDDNHYRAIVTNLEGDKVGISYVDFGNKEVVPLNKLQILPESLEKERSCVAKILLKDVPHNIPMTKEASDYLLYLTGKEEPLTCTFNGIPSKDGVYLKSVNGENINNKIKELLKPSWEREDYDDKTVYMVDDLSVASMGDVGQFASAIVLCCISVGHKYVMCPLDRDLLIYAHDIMPRLMRKFCESTEYYIPRENELCLALYKDEWCRAVCLVPNIDNKCTLFFVDFGNIEDVEREHVRLMIKDFLTPNALGSICTIKNIGPYSDGNFPPKISTRLSELLAVQEIIRIKIVEYLQPGEYVIEVPDICSTLVEENLLS